MYIIYKSKTHESIYNDIQNYLSEQDKEKQPFRLPYYWGDFAQGLE